MRCSGRRRLSWVGSAAAERTVRPSTVEYILRLEGSNGQSLQLTIVGYQFPAMRTKDYDSNWLNVQVSVVHPRGRWTARDACLLTYEAARLADWLQAVGRGKSVASEESFIEPNLAFRLVESAQGPFLRVYFELELRPEWAFSRAAFEEDLWVEFPVGELDLVGAAEGLRQQLRVYPQRAAR